MSVSSVGSTASYATSVSVQVVQVRVELLPPATQTNVSQTGTLLSRLDELSKSDPEKFKAAMSQVATALRDQAGKASGRQAQVLGLLADRFEATAKSGSLETLWKAPEKVVGSASGAAAGSSSAAPGSSGATAATSGSAGGASAAAGSSSASTPAASTSTASGAAASDQAAASAQAASAAATQKTDPSASEVERKGRSHHHRHHRHGGHRQQDDGGGEGQGWTPGKLLSMVADVVRAALDSVLGAPRSTDTTAPASTASQGSSGSSTGPVSTTA